MIKKYIYICAAGHSGSTLLDLLLGSHSKVESLGEITQLPKNISLNTICMCGKPVKECGLWTKVLSSIGEEMGVDLLSHPYVLNLGFINAQVIVDHNHQNSIYNYRRKFSRALNYATLAYGPKWLYKARIEGDHTILNNFRLYKNIMHFQGVNCIVDSSKDYLKAVKLYYTEPKKVKLILLVRDGRGVFYSNLKRGASKKESLMAWLNHSRRAIKLINRHIPERDYLIVKYEDLGADTRRELRRICDFVGLEYEENMLEFLAQTHHIANGNNMRFASSAKIRLDLAWQEKLGATEIDYFKRVAGSINQRFGYPDAINKRKN